MAWDMRKFASPEIKYGIGARNLVGQYAKDLGGQRALIVTYPDVISAGWIKNIQVNLGAEGIKSAVYADVTPNTKDKE